MLRTGARARVAHVTIRNMHGARRTVAVRSVRVRPGAVNRLAVRLTRRETRQIRPGRYAVRVSLSGATGPRGNVQVQILRVTAR